MAGAGMTRYLKDTSDPAVPFDGVAKTATFNSEWIPVEALGEVFGLLLKLTSTSGTSPTLDIDLEWSPDGGTTVGLFPGTDNDATQATVAQQTADTTEPHLYEYWVNPLSGVGSSADGANPVVRFEFTIGGTSPSFTIEAWITGARVGI